MPLAFHPMPGHSMVTRRPDILPITATAADVTRAEMDASALLPHLIPRTASGMPKLAITRHEAADLCSCSVDTIRRIPHSELPIIDGQPARYLLSDVVLYLERKRRRN